MEHLGSRTRPDQSILSCVCISNTTIKYISYTSRRPSIARATKVVVVAGSIIYCVHRAVFVSFL